MTRNQVYCLQYRGFESLSLRIKSGCLILDNRSLPFTGAILFNSSSYCDCRFTSYAIESPLEIENSSKSRIG